MFQPLQSKKPHNPKLIKLLKKNHNPENRLDFESFLLNWSLNLCRIIEKLLSLLSMRVNGPHFFFNVSQIPEMGSDF